MTEYEAIEFLASWGSYTRSGDPGSCMYGFRPESGLVVHSEQHRENCITWLEKCAQVVEGHSEHCSESELEDIATVIEMLREAPVKEEG